jgi:hypothetical protein
MTLKRSLGYWAKPMLDVRYDRQATRDQIESIRGMAGQGKSPDEIVEIVRDLECTGRRLEVHWGDGVVERTLVQTPANQFDEDRLRLLLRKLGIEKRKWPRPKITLVRITRTKKPFIPRALPPQLGKLSPRDVYVNTVLSVDGPKSVARRAVACAVAKHAKPDGTPFGDPPSHQQLADEAGVARSTVIRGVETLRLFGWLEWKKIDSKHGTRGGFRYFLMMPSRVANRLMTKARKK